MWAFISVLVGLCCKISQKQCGLCLQIRIFLIFNRTWSRSSACNSLVILYMHASASLSPRSCSLTLSPDNAQNISLRKGDTHNLLFPGRRPFLIRKIITLQSPLLIVITTASSASSSSSPIIFPFLCPPSNLLLLPCSVFYTTSSIRPREDGRRII